mmetsp:Transcript_30127/g.46039  ORF Transcript_30127/g.46039 Transcript_30127/m.46039 type:complete len:216 (+) Transcript_30127:1317-1964(+)
MEGKGHFPNWGKDQKKKKMKNPKKQKPNAALARLKRKQGQKAGAEEETKPTHFDIQIFFKAFKRFISCNGEMRSQARKLLLKDINKTMKVFLDDFNEQTFKKCVDVYELATRLGESGFDIDPIIQENLGAVLMCFGEIEHDLHYGKRIPPESEEERRARIVAEMKAKEMIEAKKEAEANGEKFDESEFKIPVVEPRKPVLMLLHLISITDLKFCA